MTGVRVASPEVLVAAGGVVRVTAAGAAEIVARATRSPRQRARLCAHPSPADALHEMLICLVYDTYIRPHRHAGKSESFHIIEGELDVVLFDELGGVREVVELGPYQSGKAFFYRLMEPCFHTVLVKTPLALFHETTNGPFDAADTEFAEWSPPEGSAAMIEFIGRLRRENST